MDLKDDEKPLKFRHKPRRYFESNAGHLFVSNINPFNSVGGHAGDAKENLINKRKNEEFFDIFDETPIKRANYSPSEALVKEIMNSCPLNKNIFIDEPYNDIDDIHEPAIREQSPDRQYSQPMVNMCANMYDTQYLSSCSRGPSNDTRYEQRVSFKEYNEDNNRWKTFSTNERLTDSTAERKGRAEKTTYCRPTLNMYNQEFVYKTMHRNARLQKLVRKLVLARRREKQREAWNNYINDLKNKHRYYSNEPSRISPQYVPGEHNTPSFIEDFYDTRFRWWQSNPCQHLLEDLYGTYHDMQPNVYDRYSRDFDRRLAPDVGSYIYDNSRICYPTCSQASLLKWNKERESNHYGYDWRHRPAGRYFRGSTILVEKDEKEKCCMFDKIQGTARPRLSCTRSIKTCTCRNKICSISKSSKPIQTEITNVRPLPLVNEEDDKNVTFTIPQKPLPGPPDNKETLQNKTENSIPQAEEPFKLYKDVDVPPLKEGTSINSEDVQVSLQESINNVKGLEDSIKQEISDQNKDFQTQENVKSSNTASVESGKDAKNDKREDVPQVTENFKDKFNKVTKNIARLKDKIRQSELETMKLKSLSVIENKVDSLMKSINSIMIDIKAKKSTIQKKSIKSSTVSCALISCSLSHLNRHRSDTYGLVRSEEYLCGLVHSNSSRNLTISEIGPSELKRHQKSSISKIDKILLEEMRKSNRVKRDIEELLNLRNDRSCSVQITFDIPTKEISTEVTKSLSKARLDPIGHVRVEEIPQKDDLHERHAQMTIAVNTDPLGLLALLKVSAETVRQLLSYMPNINYNSYFSMLQLPSRQCMSHYICNICGAAFGRPSQLSDHIDQHNLGRTRNCCVCRHTLDVRRTTRVGLFRCRYCGQRFTRAYCCELHQQTCAISMGRRHDVNSSHILLR